MTTWTFTKRAGVPAGNVWIDFQDTPTSPDYIVGDTSGSVLVGSVTVPVVTTITTSDGVLAAKLQQVRELGDPAITGDPYVGPSSAKRAYVTSGLIYSEGAASPLPIVMADPATGLVPDAALGAEPASLVAGFRAEVCPPPSAGVFANSDRTITNTGATRCYLARHAPTLKRTTSFIHFAVKTASTADDGVCIAGYDLLTGNRLWTTGRLTGLLNGSGQKRIPLEVNHDPYRPIVLATSFESANPTGATVFGRSIGAADTIDIFVPSGLTPSFATGKLIGFADAISQPLPSTMPTPLANNVNTVPLIIFSEV